MCGLICNKIAEISFVSPGFKVIYQEMGAEDHHRNDPVTVFAGEEVCHQRGDQYVQVEFPGPPPFFFPLLYPALGLKNEISK
jgi:hypothetical protein